MTTGWNRARSGATGLAALAGLVLLLAACGGGSGSAAVSSATTGSSGSPKPVAIGTARGEHGTYLTGPSGRALYIWVGDSDGASNCTGACPSFWPPLLGKGTPTSGSGVKSSALSTIVRPDGTQQVSYYGHPLYYSAADPGPRTTHGEGTDSFGERWWLVAPLGTAITTKGASAPAPPVGY